jgi:catechol 2,3-dioxygenase
LIEVRYPLQGAADHLVSEALYLADPDGNGIEIYADRPPSAWPRRDGQLQMATEPLDAPGLLTELADDGRPWEGLPPQTRIGHIHLHVADLKQAEDFYCRGLGFDLVTHYPPQQMTKSSPSALFISAGGYHHHIGLNTWAGRGAPPPPPSSVGLRFYTLYLPNREELKQVAQNLKATGVEYEDTGDAISVHDPSGNHVRLEIKNVPTILSPEVTIARQATSNPG